MSELLEKKENIVSEVKCSKRPEIVQETLDNLKTSLEVLGVENWGIPQEVEIVFREPTFKQRPLLGRVEIEGDRPVILYDRQFATKEGEERYTAELRKDGIDYPGMVGQRGTLKRELAHIVMWSVTGFDKQPSTKILDEGWANLVQKTTKEEIPKEEFKKDFKEGLFGENRDNFKIALDFKNPLPEERNLNSADSKVGTALLTWIHEKYGVEKMIELITKSPSISKNSKKFKPVELDERHEYKEEYESILEFFNKGFLTEQEANEKLKQWETKQFNKALEEVTGKDLDDAKKEFLNWLD